MFCDMNLDWHEIKIIKRKKDIYLCTCSGVRACERVYVSVYHMYASLRTGNCVRACVCVCVHACVRACVCACVRAQDNNQQSGYFMDMLHLINKVALITFFTTKISTQTVMASL